MTSQTMPGGAPLWLPMRAHGFGPDQILSHFGILEPPVDVHVLAAQLGVFVHRVHNPGWDGALKSTEQRADVWLNADVATVRERFTLAHEIGHLMRHPLGTVFRDTSVSYPGQSFAETQANQFAAELLMPSWMMRVYYSRFGRSLPRLAERFGVSLRAMEIRASALFGNEL